MSKGGPKIGKCIYCGATVYSERRQKLGREHVIPRKLGGELTVLEASCKKCEDIINHQVEHIVQNNDFYLLRHILGLPSSNPISTVAVKTPEGKTLRIGIDILLKTLIMPCLKIPLLSHKGKTEWNPNLPPVVWVIEAGKRSALLNDVSRLHGVRRDRGLAHHN